MKNQNLFLCLIMLGFLAGCSNSASKDSLNVAMSIVLPVIITEPSLIDTDDPAIWINHSNPSESLVLGTDKDTENGGVYVYNLDGKIDRSKTVLNLKRPNNIDIEYALNINGKSTDIAVFTERGRNMIRVLSLPDMKFIDNGGIEVFTGELMREPMGIALYKMPQNEHIYAIVGRKTGPSGSYLWQYILEPQYNGTIAGRLVRKFGVFSGKKEIEAIVADDKLGYIYYSDETVGVRQYYANPDSSSAELALFATSGIKGDHEGLSIYPLTDSTGYILLSDQQANQFHIFQREGFEHKLLKVVKVKAIESDGSDITSLPLNKTFAHGLFVVMSTDKTFQFYRWEDIAGNDLHIICSTTNL